MRVQWGNGGQSASLVCPLSLADEKSYSIEWRKDSKLIFSAFGEESGHVAPNMQGRLARSSSLGLSIYSLSPSDDGVYQCILTPFSRQPTVPMMGDAIRLIVNAPPTISFPSNGLIQYHSVRSNISIDCLADGTPPPEIRWIRDENVVSSNATLRINTLNEEDRGDYYCEATNVGGQTSSKLTLQFAKSTTIDFAPQNKTVMEGSNLFWHCHATAFPDRITYTWKFNSKPIKTTEVGLRAETREGELSINSVRRVDSGWYSCDAENGLGEPSTAKAYLQVQYVPSIRASNRRLYTIGAGGRTELSCDADSLPPVDRVVWSKNGVHLKATNQTRLLLPHTRDADAGIYVCQVFNSIGKSEPFEMHVVVAEPPTFSSPPPPKLFIKEGALLDVECKGFGDPLPIQYWMRKKHRLSFSHLHIPSVSHADHGLYTCVLANSVSTVTKEMMVYVQGTSPQPATIDSVKCVGEDGLTIDWTEGYDSGLAQSFTVHYEDVETGRGGVEKGAGGTRVQLGGLSRFSRYRLLVESANEKGKTNTTSIEKNVCSHLSPPTEVVVSGNSIDWQRTEGAVSYRLEYRETDTYDKTFVEMAEVVAPPYRIPSAPSSLPLEIRIRSMRPSYSNSGPSEVLRYRPVAASSEPSLWWAGVGGGLFIFVLFVLYLWTRTGCWSDTKKQRKKKRRSGSQSMYDRKAAPGDSYYETAVNLMEDRRDSGNWSGSRNDPVTGQMREAYCYDELEIEHSTAIEDMFREKYVYNSTMENARANILDELRIERLRREFKQSQL